MPEHSPSQAPHWLELLFKTNSALQSYRDYLHELLEKRRSEMEDSKDMETLYRARGAISVIKEQLLLIGNWEAERINLANKGGKPQ